MADKASRALVLYGDGLARFITPSHTHLHSFASKSSCGLLSLIDAPSSSESEDDRIVIEFAQLLDACDPGLDSSGSHEKSPTSTISERFMGMKAAIITNHSGLHFFGGNLGFTMLQYSEFVCNSHTPDEQSVDDATSGLLRLLGFEEGKVLETSQFDLVFLHIGAGEKVTDEGQMALSSDADYINALLGGLLQRSPPGSEIGSRLHLSTVMSYGNVLQGDSSNLSILAAQDVQNSDLFSLFPRQSYTVKGENLRKDVRQYCPMLFAQWQYGVTRKDMVDTFTFRDFKENGGSLVIPADRFLHEIAFKLWKAPKYGA